MFPWHGARSSSCSWCVGACACFLGNLFSPVSLPQRLPANDTYHHFQGVNNHATTLSKLTKSLSQLSLLLPSSNLTLIFYPTEALLTIVARIYSLILRFLVDSIKFYKASRLPHSLDSISRPWKLRFQDTYDDVALHAAQLKDLSSLAAKAELRDVHPDLVESCKLWEDLNAQIMHMKSAQASMKALIETKVSEQTALLSSTCDLS
jgi:hypothetical protein